MHLGGPWAHFAAQRAARRFQGGFFLPFLVILNPRFSSVPCHVLVRFRLRARVRSLFFEAFEALILEALEP